LVKGGISPEGREIQIRKGGVFWEKRTNQNKNEGRKRRGRIVTNEESLPLPVRKGRYQETSTQKSKKLSKERIEVGKARQAHPSRKER